MDLTFKRYADPFLFFDSLLITGQLATGVVEILKAHNEDSLYEYYIHKDCEQQSFEDFRNAVMNQTINADASERQIKTTVQKSQEILSLINPEEGGGHGSL